MAKKRKNETYDLKKVIVCSRYSVNVAGFRALVEETHAFSVSGCTETSHLRERLAAERTDLVVIDVNAGITLEFLGELGSIAPATGLILWVDGTSAEFVRQALDFGVRGILGKDASLEASVQCLRRVAAGELWVEEELSGRLLSMRRVKLTPREGHLVVLLTQGLTNKEIACQMEITEGTAKAYLTGLYRKTGLHDRIDLALLALRNLPVGPNGGFGGTNTTSELLSPLSRELSGTGTEFRPAGTMSLKSLPTHA